MGCSERRTKRRVAQQRIDIASVRAPLFRQLDLERRGRERRRQVRRMAALHAERLARDPGSGSSRSRRDHRRATCRHGPYASTAGEGNARSRSQATTLTTSPSRNGGSTGRYAHSPRRDRSVSRSNAVTSSAPRGPATSPWTTRRSKPPSAIDHKAVALQALRQMRDVIEWREPTGCGDRRLPRPAQQPATCQHRPATGDDAVDQQVHAGTLADQRLTGS